MAKYKCTICGYVHEGDAAPAQCPQCKQPADKFVLIEEPKTDEPAAPAPKKKGIDTNSNAYTIIYSCVVVVVVAFLLAFVYGALKQQSDENVAIDKKKQILLSLNVIDRNCEKDSIVATYDKVVTSTRIINKANEDVAVEGKTAFDISTKEISDDCLPVYVCEVNNQTKYVLPLTGRGLWGGLWGYIALESDRNTVCGVYFGHESETAGLGALIAEDKFQSQFVGKKVLDDNTGEVKLSVMKVGKKDNSLAADNRCDAVTGATLTSNGVNDMLKDCLTRYEKFLKEK